MSERNNEDKDPLYYLKLFNSFDKLQEKFWDQSLTKEEKDYYMKQLISVKNELLEYINKRRTGEQLTPDLLEKKLKSVVVPEPYKTYWERVLSTWREQEKFLNMERTKKSLTPESSIKKLKVIPVPQPVKEKIKIKKIRRKKIK